MTTRRLAAILAADVVGYSRLMGVDEEGTLGRLVEIRQAVLVPAVDRSGGRIFKTTGDGFLVEFPSAVEALRCALEIQEQVRDHENEHESERRFQFRIGINVGDVIATGDDIHGDGVNVAARLEAQAEPGGILVAANAHAMAVGRVKCTFEDAGEQRLKNIAEPVRAYRVIQASELERPTLPLPDKPSIAVLPFANMSGDPEQEYFADGMVEEIITGLSRVRSFFVIARNSSFAYKGKSPDVRQVGRELGVRYVMEGSVRKAGNRVRITGQLVDATTGAHIWADRFDGALEDVFELQDRVTNSVVGAISPSIQAAEVEKAQRKPPESLHAYDLVLRALPHLMSMERERLKESVRLLRQATEIDPTYGLAFARLAECMMGTMTHGWSQPTDAEINEMVRLSRIALNHGKDDPEVLSTAALVIGDPGGDLPAGLSLVDKALALNPNSATALLVSGYLRIHAGDAETAIQHLEGVARLSPMEYGAFRNNNLSMAYFIAERYDCAAEFAERALHDNPNYAPAMRRLAATYGLLGRAEEAKQMVRRLDVIVPGYSISKYKSYMEKSTAKGSALLKTLDTFCEGLRRAGMPE
jgi:adenylate cyclase